MNFQNILIFEFFLVVGIVDDCPGLRTILESKRPEDKLLHVPHGAVFIAIFQSLTGLESGVRFCKAVNHPHKLIDLPSHPVEFGRTMKQLDYADLTHSCLLSLGPSREFGKGHLCPDYYQYQRYLVINVKSNKKTTRQRWKSKGFWA